MKINISKYISVKPKHIIDACVIFGVVDKKNKEVQESCKKYMGAINFKYKGFVTIPILGEIVCSISKEENREFRQDAYDFLNVLFDKKQLNILPFCDEMECKLKSLFDMHQHLDHDDGCHLSQSVHHKFKYFITVDGKLVGKKYKKVREKIYDKYKLNIWSPEKAIRELDIR